MKKMKRILALIGVVLLVCLYLSTLVFAFMGSEKSLDYLKVSIYATVVVPALLWAYMFVYKLIKGEDNEESDEKEDKE